MSENNPFDPLVLRDEIIAELEKVYGTIYRENGAFVAVKDVPGGSREQTIAGQQIRETGERLIGVLVKRLEHEARSLVAEELEKREQKPTLSALAAEIARLRAEARDAAS